jgi:hypothetical protein
VKAHVAVKAAAPNLRKARNDVTKIDRDRSALDSCRLPCLIYDAGHSRVAVEPSAYTSVAWAY